MVDGNFMKVFFKLKKNMRLTKTVFFHRCFDKRRFQSFLQWFFKKSPRGQSRLLKFLEKLKFLGFHSATEAGFSISIEDLKIPPSKSSILQTAEEKVLNADLQFVSGHLTIIEHYQRILEIWHRTSEKVKYQVLQSFQSSDLFNPVYLMAFSGARGNISQIRQLVGMRGLMADPQGQIIDFPIRSNFREGLTLTEYLISCSGARKGIVDTALRTAASGYLTRRLVDVAHHVIVGQIDCQINNSPQLKGIFLESLYDQQKKILPLKQRLVGRVLAEDIIEEPGFILGSKNQEISQTLSQKICLYRKKVFVRSPLTCQSSKFICQLCYGWNLAEGQLVSLGEAVGVLAAQSIGEPGTQLTMRTFHTGGVFTGQLLDQTYAPFSGKIHYPSFCYGLLIRTSQGQIAYLSKNTGIFHLKVSYISPRHQQQLEKICWKFKKIVSFHIDKNLLEIQRKHLFEIQFVFQKTTLLYTRQGEFVKKTQLLAELPFVEKEESSENEQEIFSSISGEIHFENLIFIEKIVDEQMVKNFVQGLGEFWILSGQTFKFFTHVENSIESPFKKGFFKKFDLVNNQVPFFQVQLQPSLSKDIQIQNLFEQRSKFFLQFNYLKYKDLFISSIFFKSKGYLQIPHLSLQPFIKKTFIQILNGYNSKSFKIWKNWPKIAIFQTWKIGFQREYFNFRSQLFHICLKSKSFKVVSRIGRNCVHFFQSSSKNTFSEFPKYLFVQNFIFQKNTCILHLNRQGYLKFFGLYQDRKTRFFFQNQQQWRIQTKKIGTNFHQKNFFNQLPVLSFFPTSRGIYRKPNFSIQKFRQISFLFSLLFFNRLKFLQNRPYNWKRQNFQRRPRIIHWKNFSNHKYLFFINFFQPLLTNTDSKFIQKAQRKMGFYSSIRVFFYQEKSRKFKNSLKIPPLEKKSFEPNRNFFQLQILFSKNLLKKSQQKTHILFEFNKLTFWKINSTLYSSFFLQGFQEIFVQKKFDKSWKNIQDNLFQLFFKKQLNNFQFETFKKSSTNDIWEFLGENLFKTNQFPTYLKTFVYKKNRSRQFKNAFYTIWSSFRSFSKKKRKQKSSSKPIFFLEKIFPSSITEGSTILENCFFQKKIFPLNCQIFLVTLQKWRLDFSLKPYSFLVQNFCLIKNFEMRFSQKFPKKPVYKSFFLKKETQLIHHYKIQKSNRDFQNFYVEYISKKSSTLEYGFHQLENELTKNLNIYSLRFCPSLLIPRRFKEHLIMGRKNILKKIFLKLENQYLTCRKQTFSFSKIQKKFTKKPIHPNFQIFAYIKKPLQKLLSSKNPKFKIYYFIRVNEFSFFFIPFSKRKFQISLSSLQPYQISSKGSSKLDRILENTNLLTMRFLKIQDLGNGENFQKNSFQIIQKEFHPLCFEKLIFIRFYLPFIDGEIITDHPVFLNVSDLFCYSRPEINVYPNSGIRNFPLIFLPTQLKMINLNNWQFFHHNYDTDFKFQKRSMNIFQLGNFLRAGEIVLKNRLTFNSGQLLAKTQQNFLFRKAKIHLLNDQSIFHVQHGEILSKNQRIYSVFTHQSKTGDIIQGIPKIEEIFEARKKSKYSLHRLSILSKDFFKGQIFQYLQNLQKSVINNIQRIYCGQGIHISDKHIEIIVRQMTSNVLIVEPGQTGLLSGEIVAFQWIMKIHSTLISYQVIYEPLFLGITKTSLETSSFLSAASFQETTRILSNAALQNQIDFLSGLKQNVLLGNLLPIGTGFFRFDQSDLSDPSDPSDPSDQ